MAGVRRALSRLLTLLAVLGAGVPALADAKLWARDDYPIPPDSPTRVFFIQRSVNANTVVYEARRRADGTLDPEQPIHAYWLRYASTGERRALNFAEENFAYGVRAERDGQPGTWAVRFAAYGARDMQLRLDAGGRPVLVGEIAGRRARLVSSYLHVREGRFWPSVTAVDLYGVDLASGAALHERFVP
jgi:hypothetical protein